MSWHLQYQGIDCGSFLEQITSQRWNWVAKRLSGNDTGLTGGHQAGLYLPKKFFEMALPEIVTTEQLNPDIQFDCYFPSDNYFVSNVRAIYYNNRYFIGDNGEYGTRNEFRMTRWGGNQCPLQNKENTGALLVLFWHEKQFCCCVARDENEELQLQNAIGYEVEPGNIYFSDLTTPIGIKTGIPQFHSLIQDSWRTSFPKSRVLAEAAITSIPPTNNPDDLLLERRKLETALFYEIERIHVEPLLSKGFSTVGQFIQIANSVTNRRKSRSGRSLEYHLAQIFMENELQFEEGCITELKKKPDFLFPSAEEYHRKKTLVTLYMLAAKTCCKDRWRQVATEADKIPDKHLFTLQEGVSENQLLEMVDTGIHLVIPESHRGSFPTSRRGEILNLSNFIQLIKTSQQKEF